MKYALTILLSLSLYAPDVAKLVAYTDYVVDVVTNNKVNICDCEPIIEKQSSEHKDHHIIVKTDWTYIAAEIFYLQPQLKFHIKKYPLYNDNLFPQFSHNIFQPPKV